MKRIIISLSIVTMLTACMRKEPEITGSGVIEATEITISSAVPGEITLLSVDEGDTVEKGQTLIRLDMSQIELERAAAAANEAEIDAMEKETTARISQAQTALAGAKKQFDRARKLKKKGSISNQKYDDIDTAYRLAEKKLAAARTALAVFPAKRQALQARLAVLDRRIRDGIITSPLTCSVIEKIAEQGERALPGRPLLKLADMQHVWVKIYIGEFDLGKVKLGAAAKVFVDSFPGKSFPGRVTWVSDTAEFTPKNVQTRNARADLVYAVKVELDNPDGVFKIGMPVDVNLQGFPEYNQTRISETDRK